MPILGPFSGHFGPKTVKNALFARFQAKKQKPGHVQLDSRKKVLIFGTGIEIGVNSPPFFGLTIYPQAQCGGDKCPSPV